MSEFASPPSAIQTRRSITTITSERCLRVSPLEERAKSGVRTKSIMSMMLVREEAIVEQTVNQKDWPYVKPSLKRWMTPKMVTVMMFIISRAIKAQNKSSSVSISVSICIQKVRCTYHEH